MAVLRSGVQTSKSPKCPSSPSSSSPSPSPPSSVQHPSTPAKACEDSHPPAMARSNPSSPSETQTPPHLGLGFSPPAQASAPRRSARVASRSKGPDSAAADDRSGSRLTAAGCRGRGAEGGAGGRRGRRTTRGGRGGRDSGRGASGGDEAVVDAVSEDGDGLDLNVAGEVSLESNGVSVGVGNETGCVTGALNAEGGNGGERKRNEKQMDESSPFSVLSYSRRKSRRLMEKFEGGLRCELMLDLNSVPEDGGQRTPASKEAELGYYSGDQVMENVELGLSSGLRFLRQSERLGGSVGAGLGSNLKLDSNSVAKDGSQLTDTVLEKVKGGLKSNVVLDLNSVPEDGGERISASKEAELGSSNQLQVTKDGESVLSFGLRYLRRSARLGGNAQGELGSNLNLDLNLGSLVKDGNLSGDTAGSMAGTKRKYSKGEKQTSVEDNPLAASTDAVKIDSEMDCIVNGSISIQGKRRYTKEDKGKGKLLKDDYLVSGHHPVTLYPDTENLLEKLDSVVMEGNEKEHMRKEGEWKGEAVEIMDVIERKKTMDVVERNKARFLDTAKEYASKFAHFKPEDEGDYSLSHSEEGEPPSVENGPEVEDWPGPFATAMKIIKDRDTRLSARQGNSMPYKSESAPVILWKPSQESQDRVYKRVVPTLQDLCFNILCENADAITSLEGIPELVKSKLSWQLCDSRNMSCHILGLLAAGSPSEIRLKDCSWITEDQLREILITCKMDHLRSALKEGIKRTNEENIIYMVQRYSYSTRRALERFHYEEEITKPKQKVLQFDQCGRCLPDYIFRETVARSPNNLPSLINISLRGAYRLSDEGLSALVSSAPLLQSINLGQCSFVTSAGIINLAKKLDLRELYIDECQNVEAMLILPALKKLKHLDVLSVAGVPDVCDKFVRELLSVSGQHMKELVLAHCGKLTDNSLKAIAASCPGLQSVDLSGLLKLTDSAMGHLANGCRSLKTLKLQQNAFSDEGIAAFLEASGESLQELSVNRIKEVSSFSVFVTKRFSLDLSWCRKLTDEALGLIVDKCLALKALKLFGCTQITNKFLNGHSNALVEIVGMKVEPILTNLVAPDSLEVPLRYSLVCLSSIREKLMLHLAGLRYAQRPTIE
ncbi:hypothetical protein ACLOJK_025380 [Asimina triloba]